MTKLPRNLNGRKLSKSLEKYGYKVTRQTGSHIRLSKVSISETHHITIPDHNPIKVGTLNRIITDIDNSFCTLLVIVIEYINSTFNGHIGFRQCLTFHLGIVEQVVLVFQR